MAIEDWWVELEDKLDQNDKMQEGSKGPRANSPFTSAQWAEARKKHKAKMNERAR